MIRKVLHSAHVGISNGSSHSVELSSLEEKDEDIVIPSKDEFIKQYSSVVALYSAIRKMG